MFPYASALSTSDAEVRLLTALIQLADYPRRMKLLAETAGISAFAASRAAKTLTERGLMTQPGGAGYALSREHPDLPSILPLVWRYSGVRLPLQSRHPRPIDLGNGGASLIRERGLRGWIPDELVIPSEHTDDVLPGDGADLITARDLVTTLERLLPAIDQVVDTVREVYSVWSTERARDVKHQIQEVGALTRQAHAELIAAADWQAQGDAHPRDVTVAARPWARTAYLISGDARRAHRVITMLEHAAGVGGRVNRLRGAALEFFVQATKDGQDSQLRSYNLSEAQRALAESETLWDTPAPDAAPWHNVGGMPAMVDVGTLGDKVLAVRMVDLHNQLTEIVASMATHDAVNSFDTTTPLLTAPYQLQRPTREQMG